MSQKEAKARIKINKLLEEAGWRLIDSLDGQANVLLEKNVKLEPKHLDDLGDNFEKAKNGYIDFLLVDEKKFPLIVLEAKAENINPLHGKQQARKYADSLGCRFVILSNGNIHYFWDIQRGNPYQISKFPTPESIKDYKYSKPNPQDLINEKVESDYVALTQRPNYKQEAGWVNENERPKFIQINKLRFLRKYQLEAIRSIQKAVKEGKERFLFEMATGTGKTLVSAAVIKLFLRTGNAKRVLFLVDRLELETQAKKSFTDYLKNDYKTVIYKENRDDWNKAEIVVTTVQSLLSNNKYKTLFSPTDFDFVISDEAHRSIGGNSRAVFEYFVGYKLGLTATPKDYLKNVNPDNLADPREYERRLMLDTYKTFGCESGEPTFRYSLLDGVKDGFLINPIVVDARTEVTTQLLSDEGYAVIVDSDDDESNEEGEVIQIFHGRDFEKKFFSKETNITFCKTFMDNALLDPISGEIGKTIVFAVSQNHAAVLTNILNKIASKYFPDKYKSDFAMQVTSRIDDAQKMTVDFANNELGGNCNFLDFYSTSKTRVCVTVGMMTTGYDCPDILNICLMRPIFSPTDFVQIKGRGTRKHNFADQIKDENKIKQFKNTEKEAFKIFDFFANCEYFEEKYDYDEVIKLPKPSISVDSDDTVIYETDDSIYRYLDDDEIKTINEKQIGLEGMKIDRMFFDSFGEKITADEKINKLVKEGKIKSAVDFINENYMNKPKEYYTLEKLREAYGVDRPVTMTELIEYFFGITKKIKSKDELLDEEFEKLILTTNLDEHDKINYIKYFFKSYVTNKEIREIIDNKQFGKLNVNPVLSSHDYKLVPPEWREYIPNYVRNYVKLNKFSKD